MDPEQLSENLKQLSENLRKLSDKKLREELINRKITGKASSKKEDKVAAILHYEKQISLYEKAGIKEMPASHFTKDCRMRLLNIIFSDKHCASFARIGNRPSRADLDEGKVAENSDFWQGIAEDWGDQDAYNHLVQNSPLFADINPALPSVISRDAAKLRGEYLSLSRLYASALRKYTTSGTHEDEFFNFCDGNVAVYYMRIHLSLRPNLNNVVVTRLDESSSFDSLGNATSDSLGNPTFSSSMTATPPKQQNMPHSTRIQVERNKFLESVSVGFLEMRDLKKAKFEMAKESASRDNSSETISQMQSLSNLIRTLQMELEATNDDEEAEEIRMEIQEYRKRRRELKSTLKSVTRGEE
jgi:hypothetical protein